MTVDGFTTVDKLYEVQALFSSGMPLFSK